MRQKCLIKISVGVGMVGLMLYPVISALVRARRQEHLARCLENLVKIDGAKQQWALENGKRPDDRPTWSDLVPPEGKRYLKEIPICPSVGTTKSYLIGKVNGEPECASGVPAHSLIYGICIGPGP